MPRPSARAGSAPDHVLDLVAELLDTRGYDGWQLREVADLAHVSLATVYKRYTSREELILCALVRWLEANTYQPLREEPTDLAPFDALRLVFRALFQPWEKHPRMLEVFVRVSTTNGASRLEDQASLALEPLRPSLDLLGPEFAEDVGMIMANVMRGLLTGFVAGDVALNDILPNLDRTLTRLEAIPREETRSGKQTTGRSRRL